MEPDRVDPLPGQLMFDDALDWYTGRYHTAAHGAVSITISLDAAPASWPRCTRREPR